FACSGEELMKIIQTNVRAAAREEPGVLQISGLSYQFRVTPGGTVEIANAMINGQAIDPQTTYLGATIDFILFGQAERYFGFAPSGKTENTNQLLSDVVMSYIESQPAVSSAVEGRMARLP
ncbi:MAG TPA: 5'-nucleotidase C-terminal domain-containing protein, partial [bacterium]|nr:5'-nucleotidase C-terminal domain-containing protein [bacterium]